MVEGFPCRCTWCGGKQSREKIEVNSLELLTGLECTKVQIEATLISIHETHFIVHIFIQIFVYSKFSNHVHITFYALIY